MNKAVLDAWHSNTCHSASSAQFTNLDIPPAAFCPTFESQILLRHRRPIGPSIGIFKNVPSC